MNGEEARKVMSDTQIGWAPPDLVQRPVELPDWLDRKVISFALAHRSTPSALLADALGDAAEHWSGEEAELTASENEHPGNRVARKVILEPSISKAIDAQISKLQERGLTIEFSDLATAIVTVYIEKLHSSSSPLSNETLPG